MTDLSSRLRKRAEYYEEWARDIRKMNGQSVDADYSDATARELREAAEALSGKDDRYVLRLTPDQTHTVSRACEMAARVGMCQLDVLVDALPNPDKEFKNYAALRDVMKHAEQLVKSYTGPESGGYYGIRHALVPILAKRAWDVHAVVRHRLSWDRAISEGIVEEGAPRNWKRMMGVSFDEPDNVTGEPLPTISPGSQAVRDKL